MRINGHDALYDRRFAEDIVDTFGPFIPAEEITGLEQDEVAQAVIDGLAASPVPAPVLLDLSSRSGFSGRHILEKIIRSVLSGEFPDLEAPVSHESLSAVKNDPAPGDRDGIDPEPGGEGNSSSAEAALCGKITVEKSFDLLFDLLGERRSGQVEMAHMVLDSFRSGKIAFIEAGTGTGKSLAYLVPSILHASETGEKIIISTHTRNLQNQLMTKEIPLLGSVLGIDVDVVRLMGRENYICSRKLVSAVSRISEDDPSAALSLALSGALTITGRIESLSQSDAAVDPGKLRAPARCMMNGCSHSDTCPLLIARKKARAASIVFVNHALILTDYRQGGSVLGPYDCVVFDEAHHIEHCVMENLSVRVFNRDLGRILEAVSPVSASAPEWKLFLSMCGDPGGSSGVDAGISGLAAQIERLQVSFSSVFSAISNLLDPGKKLRSRKTRYQDGKAVFAEIEDELNNYRNVYNEFRETLKPLLEVTASSAGLVFQQKLKYMEEELIELSAALEYLVAASDDESVFWVEWSKAGTASGLCGSPLAIDRRFADFIEENCSSAIFTSATLASEGRFSSVKKRLGTSLSGLDCSELIVPSPFDYKNNFLIIIQRGLGDPNQQNHALDAAEIIAELAIRVKRRILVLFTSHSMCRMVAGHLERADLPGPVFVQGISGSREEVAGNFKAAEGAILLGVASFWEGVDFPGEQLEVIVIPKLPFPVPNEPIVEAMSDRLRREGEDPFDSLFLPEAVMRLRQGIGRVIRRTTDRGVAVILDPRMESRPYSKKVVSSLPSEPTSTEGIDDTVNAAAAWFADLP